MSFIIEFPEPEKDIVVETGLMQRTVRRTMAVHRGGALVVWSGPARNGKTRTADWMVHKIDEAYDSSPHAFRAVHYEVGEIPRWSGHEMKRGIRSLYHATMGKLPEAAYRQCPSEDLAAQLVHGLQAKNIQMVLVDEAGLLSLDAIRGMVLVRDVAEISGWTLTLVFIGMDDLPTTMEKLPQIRARIHEWCHFKPYSSEETHSLLAALHPHFAGLDFERPEDRAEIEFVHQQTGGLPGLIVPFLRRLSSREREMDYPIDLSLLRAVHLLRLRDQEAAVTDATSGYADGKSAAEVKSVGKGSVVPKGETKVKVARKGTPTGRGASGRAPARRPEAEPRGNDAAENPASRQTAP